jgi:hypothetical protein
MSRLFWFQLVDSAGQPYQEVVVASVSISSTSVVDQFRDAVKHKFADSHLRGVPPTALQVYRNKIAFDNRNSLAEAKQDPMDTEAILTDFGESKKDAIYVVVPQGMISFFNF